MSQTSEYYSEDDNEIIKQARTNGKIAKKLGEMIGMSHNENSNFFSLMLTNITYSFQGKRNTMIKVFISLHNKILFNTNNLS